jgi:hypothetical protein
MERLMPSKRAPVLLAAGLLVFVVPAVVLAGMPSARLSDMARLRFETISFFLVVFLLASWLIQLLWNYLARDFKFLPRLNYPRALGVVFLWGLLFVLVLTMISGARELMTPGAWEKQGATYKVARDQPAGPVDVEHHGERQEKLRALRRALWEYAQKNQGSFPSHPSSSGLPADSWRVPDPTALSYHYVPGQKADVGAVPLVYEPGIYGPQRYTLFTDGSIRQVDAASIPSLIPKQPNKQ